MKLIFIFNKTNAPTLPFQSRVSNCWRRLVVPVLEHFEHFASFRVFHRRDQKLAARRPIRCRSSPCHQRSFQGHVASNQRG